jgi:predicted RNA-binding Zn-ribbon protein involved in translation (DUF1610 family)
MARIVITCPSTGKDVDTGMALPAATFPTVTLSQNRVPCPHCGQTHVWDKKDARLVKDPGE